MFLVFGLYLEQIKTCNKFIIGLNIMSCTVTKYKTSTFFIRVTIYMLKHYLPYWDLRKSEIFMEPQKYFFYGTIKYFF